MNTGKLPWLISVLLAWVAPAWSDSTDQTIAQAQRLAARHRYGEVIELLAGMESASNNPEVRYIVAAELGRAYFHLGMYPESHQRFRRAVSIHPDRAETALYLEATAYLLGDREQAFLILREVLKSGARDLYQAVTLPGERRFLGEPEVWELLDEPRTLDELVAAVTSRYAVTEEDCWRDISALLDELTRRRLVSFLDG